MIRWIEQRRSWRTDVAIQSDMQDELLRLQSEQARTVVFITHDLDEAMRVGDRIAIMQAGEVVHDRNRRYLGTVSAESLEACIGQLAKDEEGNIEQAFVEGVPVIDSRTPLTELLEPVAESPHPVPVVDEHGRYLGTISRGTPAKSNKSEIAPAFGRKPAS